jgi:DnaJ family protein C protein 1
MKMNYARDKKRVDYFESAARTSAGLPAKKEEGAVNGNGNGPSRRRKVKVPMVAGSEFSGQLELIVDGEDVFIVSSLVLFLSDELMSSPTETGQWNLSRT